jgi:hypothetical protein
VGLSLPGVQLASHHSRVVGADGDRIALDDAGAGARLGAVDTCLELRFRRLDGLAVDPRLAVGEFLLCHVEPDFDEAGARGR